MSVLAGLRQLTWMAALAALCLPAPAGAVATAGSAHEYDLKAAFLFNFAQFVEWPEDAFPSPSTPITIGIVGEDPFGTSLDEIVANETAHDRKLVVRRYKTVDEVDACHILFIGHAESKRLDRIPPRLGNHSILTVGETPDFTAHDGMIGFQMAKNRLRLRINAPAARAARLVISSKLLRQAEIVGSEKTR